MELTIKFSDDLTLDHVIELKNFIDEESIDGVQDTSIDKATLQKDQMGGAIFLSITAFIQAASQPLTELVKCLQKYVDTYRTPIELSTKDGIKIKIDKGRSLSAHELIEIIDALKK